MNRETANIDPILKSYLDKLIFNINEMIVCADLSGGIALSNSAAEKTFGYSTNELVGMSLSALFGDKDSYDSAFSETLNRGTYEGEMVCVRKNGEEFHSFISTGFIKAPDEESTGIIMILRDITEQKRTEEALKVSKECVEILITSSLDMIISVDNQRRIMEFNPAAEKAFGYTKDEIIGKHIDLLYHSSSDGRQLSSLITTKTGYYGEVKNKRKNGEIFDSYLSASEMRDSNGNLVGVMGISRDITEKKRMERELMNAQKLESVGTLAGGIAHDLNNILTAILGNISILKIHTDEEDKTFQNIKDLEAASRRASSLTQQLLTFSKGGHAIIKLHSIDKVLIESVDSALRYSNTKCKYSIDKDLWYALVDQGQFSQAIKNIVDNAKQAMSFGGTLYVRAENIENLEENPVLGEGKHIKIEIEDEGIGITEDDLTKIFDPYFTTNSEGRGLGLSIAYSIVKSHSGLIRVESRRGEGAKFTIYIPASHVQKAAVEEEPVIRIIHGTGKILLMDDDEMVQSAVKGMLIHLGYDVIVTGDGAEAVEIYKGAVEDKSPFSLVLMDLMVPGGMGGMEATREILKLDEAARVLVSSGYSNDPAMSKFEEFGFCGVVQKPYNIGELSMKISEILDESH